MLMSILSLYRVDFATSLAMENPAGQAGVSEKLVAECFSMQADSYPENFVQICQLRESAYKTGCEQAVGRLPRVTCGPERDGEGSGCYAACGYGGGSPHSNAHIPRCCKTGQAQLLSGDEGGRGDVNPHLAPSLPDS